MWWDKGNVCVVYEKDRNLHDTECKKKDFVTTIKLFFLQAYIIICVAKIVFYCNDHLLFRSFMNVIEIIL